MIIFLSRDTCDVLRVICQPVYRDKGIYPLLIYRRMRPNYILVHTYAGLFSISQ